MPLYYSGPAALREAKERQIAAPFAMPLYYSGPSAPSIKPRSD